MRASESQSLPKRAAAVPHPERRIQATAVCTICGGICLMTLWRWLNDPTLDFPRPIYIGRRRYWREAEILAWLDAREVTA
ncbi:helix-turn-helix transcriptional regulator [Pararhodobacter aggregans]